MSRQTYSNSPSRSEQVIQLAKRAGVIRARDLAAQGIPRVYLKRLQEKGVLEQVGRGLYTLTGAAVTEHHTLAEAVKRVPHGAVCLLSALSFHKLTTQAPFEVWLAIDPSARKPRLDYPPLRIVRMTGEAREAGIEEHTIEGVPVRITSAAKTVVDCFKFRNKLGLDVALEALRDYRRDRRRSLDDLWRFAKICRVANVMRPYLESVA
ncbi:MAG: type IV toxin-antitoxin system AbiEi family antitoxin domain-containing protein [Planctomycetes bacterium]|nr:type IV toxin-antitoxin system AbiEi family antitoxin domain-containing protein [Planctomycetota bacterium]